MIQIEESGGAALPFHVQQVLWWEVARAQPLVSTQLALRALVKVSLSVHWDAWVCLQQEDAKDLTKMVAGSTTGKQATRSAQLAKRI